MRMAQHLKNSNLPSSATHAAVRLRKSLILIIRRLSRSSSSRNRSNERESCSGRVTMQARMIGQTRRLCSPLTAVPFARGGCATIASTQRQVSVTTAHEKG